MTITHILFDLHGTLVDGDLKMPPCYAENVGRVMAERFGGQPEDWAQANRKILADWDSYYADLDFTENGLTDIREGELRTTRALFRLTGIPEPDLQTLMQLSPELPYLATRSCNALFPDSRLVIEQLYAAGCRLGIASGATTRQAQGTLEGGGITDYFTGPILGPDVTECLKSREFYLAAGLAPETCLVVDDKPDGIEGARAAGMQTVQIFRGGRSTASLADFVITGDLYPLLDLVKSL